MQECISYAHTYVDFGKNGNGKNLVMQDCISFARTYTDFGKNENFWQNEIRKLHKLCSYLCTI